jgi:hypothetical protein
LIDESVPKVRDEVKAEDLRNALVVYPCTNDAQPECDSDVRNNNLGVMMGCEHHSLGIKVCKRRMRTGPPNRPLKIRTTGAFRVSALARSVGNDICRPSSELK